MVWQRERKREKEESLTGNNSYISEHTIKNHKIFQESQLCEKEKINLTLKVKKRICFRNGKADPPICME